MDYESLNISELVTIALELEPEAHRGMPRDLLIQIIEGESPRVPERTLNKKRLKIMSFINEHWLQVAYQVSCPAKSRDPRACFSCCDMQAVMCSVTNEDKIRVE